MRTFTVFAALWTVLAFAQTEPDVLKTPAEIAGEVSGERISHQDKQSDWPAIAYSHDGTLFATYIQWNDKDADHVVVRRRSLVCAGG